jgi:hypothetical protein
MDTKKTYFDITQSLWKMFKEDIEHAGTENDAETWLALVGKYDMIYKQYHGTPYERYASEMILAHVHELENIWRRAFFDGVKPE